MPGVSSVNFRGLPPGFQLTGGRGISMPRDGPVLLRLAPQRKGNRAATERLVLLLAREHVLQLVVLQQLASLRHQVPDLVLAPHRHDDRVELDGRSRHFRGFRLGDGQRDFAFRCLRFGGGFLLLGDLRLLRHGSLGAHERRLRLARRALQRRAGGDKERQGCKQCRRGSLSGARNHVASCPLDSGRGSLFDDTGL